VARTERAALHGRGIAEIGRPLVLNLMGPVIPRRRDDHPLLGEKILTEFLRSSVGRR